MRHRAHLVFYALLAGTTAVAACGATTRAPAARSPIFAQTIWSRADANQGVLYTLDAPPGPSTIWTVSKR